MPRFAEGIGIFELVFSQPSVIHPLYHTCVHVPSMERETFAKVYSLAQPCCIVSSCYQDYSFILPGQVHYNSELESSTFLLRYSDVSP